MYILNMCIFLLIVLFVFAINFYQYRRTVVRHTLLHWFRVSRELLLLEEAAGKPERKLQCDIEMLDKFFRDAAKDGELSRSPEFLAVESARKECLKVAEAFNQSLHGFPGKTIGAVIRAQKFYVPDDFVAEE